MIGRSGKTLMFIDPDSGYWVSPVFMHVPDRHCAFVKLLFCWNSMYMKETNFEARGGVLNECGSEQYLEGSVYI